MSSLLQERTRLDGESINKSSGHCICRLCLQQIPINTCSLLEGIKHDMLLLIIPELSLATCTFSTICADCERTLQESYNYKSACLEIEERLQECKEKSVCNTLNLKNVCGYNENFTKTQSVCRTCLKLYTTNICTALSMKLGDPLKDMLDRCLPEINLDISLNPVICQICLEVLENLFNFIMQCLDSEEKINYYRVENDASGVVDLYKVYLFMRSMESSFVVNDTMSDILAGSCDHFDPSQSDGNSQASSYDANDQAGVNEIKCGPQNIENDVVEKFNSNKSNQIVIIDSDSDELPESMHVDLKKHENTDEIKNQKKVVVGKTKQTKSLGNNMSNVQNVVKNEETKAELIFNEAGQVIDKKNLETEFFGQYTDIKTNIEEDKSKEAIENTFNLNDLLEVKKVVKVVEKTKIRRIKKKVIKTVNEETNKNVETEKKSTDIKCEKTNVSSFIKKSVYYEDDDDRPVFKRRKRKVPCPKCNRKFFKGYLGYHLKEKCKGLDVQSKENDANVIQNNFEDSTSRNVAVDNGTSNDFKSRKCKWCTMIIDSIDTLKSHFNVHRIHKCVNCPMTFIKKGSRDKHQVGCLLNLKKRKKKHQNSDNSKKRAKSSDNGLAKIHGENDELDKQKSETKTAEVEHGNKAGDTKVEKPPQTSSGYMLKQSYIYDTHKLVMFKCKLCSYQSRKKPNLIRHLKTHNKPSELKMYSCHLCPYKSIKPGMLTVHLKIHDMESTSSRRCFLCSFVTEDEAEFQKHMVEHKSSDNLSNL